jgi:N-acetylgalactosamine-6-sulfatase
MKNIFLAASIIGFSIITLGCNQDNKQTEKVQQPNILFIFTDDQGYQDLSCYGHPYIQTPNLDKLAFEGTRFNQFYVNATVCSPSRAAFMTGRYPARDRIHGYIADDAKNLRRDMPNWLDENVPTVADIAKKAGYVTGHYGKWHLGHSTDAPDPSEYGFDEHRTFVSNGRGWDEHGNLTDKDEVHATIIKDRSLVDSSGFWANSTDYFVDEAIKFLERNKEKNFYLNLWAFLPHSPLMPSQEQFDEYADLDVISPDSFSGWMREDAANEENFESYMRTYMAAVTAADQAIGRLLDKLDQLGLSDNTLVFFTSDNGPENPSNIAGMGSPGVFRGRKRSMYEGGIRMPCIARWPGKIPEGRVDSTSVFAGVDWLPTIAALLNQDSPNQLDGVNALDVLKGDSWQRQQPLFWEYRFTVHGNPQYKAPGLCIRQGDWKLFINEEQTRTELYNIVNDPQERYNLAEKNPEKVQELLPLLLNWKKSIP